MRWCVRYADRGVEPAEPVLAAERAAGQPVAVVNRIPKVAARESESNGFFNGERVRGKEAERINAAPQIDARG